MIIKVQRIILLKAIVSTSSIRNASFRFYAETTDDELVPMGTELVDDIKQGWSYRFEYDFDNDEVSWYYWTPEEFTTSRSAMVEKITNLEKDLILYDYEGQSVSIR